MSEDDSARSPGVEIEDLCLSFLVRQAWLNMRVSVDATLAGLDLSVAQYACLLVLERQPDLTIADIARAMTSTRQSANELLGGLTEHGLVERRPHPKDRRSHLISITAAGRDRLAEAHPLVRKTEEQMEAGLTRSERAAARHWLQGVVAFQNS